MKHLLPTLFLVFSPTLACLAQDLHEPLEMAPPRCIVQTGIGLQLLGERTELFTISVETPLDPFWHFGIQGSRILPKRIENSFGFSGEFFDKFLGGYEVGGFGKYFLHGKYSGRKSAIYLGAEIHVGALRSEGQFFGGFFPEVYSHRTLQRTQKYLVRWGAQWRFGRYALLELALPLGLQHSKFIVRNTVSAIESPPTTSQGWSFIVLPIIQFGFAL